MLGCLISPVKDIIYFLKTCMLLIFMIPLWR